MNNLKTNKQKPSVEAKHARSRALFYTCAFFAGVSLFALGVTSSLAQSSSSSYELDYERNNNEAGQDTSASYQLIGATTSLSVEGDSSTYQLRNVYAENNVTSLCGNGIKDGGEQCDGSDFGASSCTSFGYTEGSLSCNPNCTVNTLACSTTFPEGGGSGGGSGSGYICGNGIKEGMEQCDDGNKTNGDGCSAICRKASFCGNGIQETGEMCDDGNGNSGDGCSSFCVIETAPPVPVEEPKPVIKPVVKPVIKPVTPPAEEVKPVEVKPVVEAPTEPEELHPSAPEVGIPDFHYEIPAKAGAITVLDRTPFIVTTLAPNTLYELVVKNPDGSVVETKQGQTDENGTLKIETTKHLDFQIYDIEIRNTNHEIVEAYTITIEDQVYRPHEITGVNGEAFTEVIEIGSFPVNDTLRITGEGQIGTHYYAYVQSAQANAKGDTNTVFFTTATADEAGKYSLEIPDTLTPDTYIVNIVQVFKDGKVSRNKLYQFELKATPEPVKKVELKGSAPEKPDPSLIWMFTVIILAFLMGIQSILAHIEKTKNKKSPHYKGGARGGRKTKTFLSLALALALALVVPSLTETGTAFAVSTTPAVFVYEGKLLDSSSTPVTSSQTFRFSLWSSDDLIAGDITGLGAINTLAPAYSGWQETHTLIPNTDGTFFVELGSSTALPDMDFSAHKFLQVEIKPSTSADTSYEVMDPTGDTGADTNDRQTLGSTPYTNNADFLDNAEVGTSDGDIATLGTGDMWDINYIPGGTNADTFVLDSNDTQGAGDTIDLQFGTTLGKTLKFDITNNWFEFSNNVNFAQHELKNAVLDNESSNPISPNAGQIYHNTSDNNTYIWNGTAWEDVNAAGATPSLDDTYNNDSGERTISVDDGDVSWDISSTYNYIVDLQGSGAFQVQDGSTNVLEITGAGGINFNPTIGQNFTVTTLGGGDVSLGSSDTFGISGVNNSIISTSTGDITLSAGDDLILDDAQLTGTVQLSASDTDWNATFATDGIVDNINSFALTTAGNGASNVGIQDTGTYYTGTTVEDALQEIGATIGAGTFNNTVLNFHPEYPDTVVFTDGTNNDGTLISDYDNTNDKSYYGWTSTKGTTQDIDLIFHFKLPTDFASTGDLTYEYQTGTVTEADNDVEIRVYNLTDGNTLCASDTTNGTAGVWATGTITAATINTGCTGGTALNAGDIVRIEIRLMDNSGATDYADVSSIDFDYSN